MAAPPTPPAAVAAAVKQEPAVASAAVLVFPRYSALHLLAQGNVSCSAESPVTSGHDVS